MKAPSLQQQQQQQQEQQQGDWSACWLAANRYAARLCDDSTRLCNNHSLIQDGGYQASTAGRTLR
jgi:hypothetical protein